ncbi:hypothetical protein P9857_08120 [Anoxybacillus geothermalis]|nr:hypothetical protein [Anoxybacillus geothermalis]WJQ00123.1 hypothetical protein QT234_16235 [Geobacillus stearothermophilus]
MRNKAVMSRAEAKPRSRRLCVGKLVMAVGSRQRLFSRGHRYGVEEALSSFPASFALASWRLKWNMCLLFGRKAMWSGS